MTAKNIGGKSDVHDRYYTPVWCVEECLSRIVPVELIHKSPIFLEPGAGSGNIVRTVAKTFPNAKIHAFDLKKAGSWTGADLRINGWNFLKEGHPTSDAVQWMKRAKMEGFLYDVIVGNPPYTYALDFMERSLLMSRCVIMIVRQGFMSSKKRREFFQKNKPDAVFLLPNRPIFTGNHGDTADYCWIRWRTDLKVNQTKLYWMPLVDLERRKQG